MGRKRENNGITLISLIVTIIVLLILTMIVINLVLSENGIFDHAKRADFESNFRRVEEEIHLEQFDKEIATILNEKKEQNIIGNQLTQDEKIKIKTLQEIVEQLREKEISQVELYWINLQQLNLNMKHQYIIDGQTGQIYDYEGERYYGTHHHTLEEKQIAKEEWIPDPTPNDINDLKIYTIEDLVRFSNAVNTGETFEGKIIELMNSLDFKSEKSYTNPQTIEFGDVNQDNVVEELIVELSKEKGFTPIGTYDTTNMIEKSFKGTFDGKNHQILNLYEQETANRKALGLFGLVEDANICNLKLNNMFLNNQSSVGGIVGQMQGTTGKIQNCMTTGEIQSTNSNVGGIIGYSDCSLEMISCINEASITGNGLVGGLVGNSNKAVIKLENCSNSAYIKGNYNIGGLIGYIIPRVEITSLKNCYNRGKIEGNMAGGIIGQFSQGRINEIINCYNEGEISATGSGRSGGLMGETMDIEISIMQDCYNKGKVISKSSQASGLIPHAKKIGQIINCYNLGNIESYYATGGLVGDCNETTLLLNCYNKGNINSTYNSEYTGGLIGQVSRNITIQKCYNAGIILSKQSCGGLIGYAPYIDLLEESNNMQNIENQDASYVGGLIGQSDTITILRNCNNEGNIVGKSRSGGIVGYGMKIENLQNCQNIGNIKSGGQSGGICGFASQIKRIQNCTNKGSVEGLGDKSGGIIGYIASYNVDIIEGCTNEGTIKGKDYVAGIVGACHASITKIKNCQNTGEIIGTDTAGGLFGYLGMAFEEMETCFNKGNVTGISTGGIIGRTTGLRNINKVYNTGNIVGTTVGGILGSATGGSTTNTIQNVYNLGNIKNDSDTGTVGGIIGFIASSIQIRNSYQAGTVTGGSIRGSFIGEETEYSMKIENCYYSQEGNAIGKKHVEINFDGLIYRSISEMKKDEFLNVLDSSNTIWKRDDTKNEGLPELTF